MSEYKDQAVTLLQETSKKLGELTDMMSRNINNEGYENARMAYKIVTELDIQASQLSGEVKTVEGKCEVDNACAKVVIGGIPMRDDMQFEVEIDGEWCKGHRANSQYGQIFCPFSSERGPVILGSNYNGRVTFPLTRDE